MDPMSVLRILWRHKLIAAPFLVLTIGLFVGALFFGPRAYQATSSFAMITPSLPSSLEIEERPELAVATDNPYLRSADPTLVLQVGKTRLSSEEAAMTLQSEGLSTDFVVGAGLSTSAQILTITANSADPKTAVLSANRLGEILDEQIKKVQLVNGASDRYLITVQTINEATGATERVSSRLRNAAVAGIGGVVLLIAAVAVARSIDERRTNKIVTSTAPAPSRTTSTEAPRPQPLSTQRSAQPVEHQLPQRPVTPPKTPQPQRAVIPRTVPARVPPARPLSSAPQRRTGQSAQATGSSHPNQTSSSQNRRNN